MNDATIKIAYDKTLSRPATWSLATGQGGFTALVNCPLCGRPGSLSRHHTIQSSGNVVPSVVCGFEDCEFHAYVFLEDWTKHNGTAQTTAQ